MPRVLLVLFIVALTVYSFIDVLRRDSSNMPARIPKPYWAILTLIVPVIGPLLWIFFKNQHLFTSTTPMTGDALKDAFGPRRKAKGPVAPDDDPEFLARLEAQNRRRAYEQKKREEMGDTAASAPSADTPEEPDDLGRGGLYGSF
ncbi:MAG: hypothetical protein GX483_03680 [Actinomycetaceae bacterium]|nr:hypothetical protein [Actinomycetaceae bacterium]